MKRILPLLCAVLCALSVSAQAPMCMRDSVIYQTDSLLWPLPYTAAAPNYNLNDACIDHAYNQSVTVNVPTTFMNLPITKATIATTNAISNLPIGITYACDPPNCEFNAGSLGCIILYGTPTSANIAPDTFDLTITANVYVFGAPVEVKFPGVAAPGSHFYLTLKTAECLVGTYDLGNQLTVLKSAPNPFSSQTVITAESQVASDFQFEVFDLLGQRVHAQTIHLEFGLNEFTFDASTLANGAYFYALSNRDGKAVRRMVITK